MGEKIFKQKVKEGYEVKRITGDLRSFVEGRE